VDLSGIIFVVLAVAWAVFLIPKALKHHDEVARTRSIDRFSDSTRVLARREPVNDRDSRLVVTPAGPVTPARAQLPAAAAPAPRASARAAARRRRRLLGLLLLGVVATTAAAALGYLPWWAVAVPSGVTLLFLAVCRIQVRREARRVTAVRRDVDARRVVREPAVAPVVRAQETSVATEEYVPTQRAADEPLDANGVTELDQEDTAGIPVADLRAAGLAGEGDGSLWDPLPVTLPTYVTAPKAHRTVRTIDLGEPGTWTSGRTAEDAEIAVQAAQPDSPDETGRHAVGS
jgi:hypothetical protein